MGVGKPGPQSDAAASAQALRQARARRLSGRFGIWVVLPTLGAVLYYGIIASDLYQSVSSFVIESAEARGAGSLESLIGAIPGSGSAHDALAVREFILSRDMLARLDRELGFIQHYQDGNADWWSRLSPDSSFEDCYEYYQDKVNVSYDSLSGVLTLEVLAYSAERAQAFARAIIRNSEQMVNRLSERARLDGMRFAKEEVAEAEARLAKAREDVLRLQQEGADINPEQTASTVLSIRGSLQAELAKARAELNEARSFMHADAPKVIALTQRVRSLAQQVELENRRLVDPKKESLNTSVARFEPAMLEKEFSEKAYGSALSSLELARMEASRQHRYLATIAPPSAPDEATHPGRLLGVASVFFISVAVFGIVSLLVAAVREHARI